MSACRNASMSYDVWFTAVSAVGSSINGGTTGVDWVVPLGETSTPFTGRRLSFKADIDGIPGASGNSTIDTGNGPLALHRDNGSPFQLGDISQGDIVDAWWDGSFYRVRPQSPGIYIRSGQATLTAGTAAVTLSPAEPDGLYDIWFQGQNEGFNTDRYAYFSVSGSGFTIQSSVGGSTETVNWLMTKNYVG